MFKYEIDLSDGVYVIGHFKYPQCPACEDAKKLLKEENIPYMFIQADKKLFGKVLNFTKSTMVPQILVNGVFIGGYEDLKNEIINLV